jgi:hypothetical protein
MLGVDGVATMTARMKKRPPKGAAAVISEAPATSARRAPIVERPDGFYWVSADGRHESGPFASIEDARADRDAYDEDSLAPDESLQEAEFEIGIADWIDPETGAPAEGQSPPHLEID